MLSAIKHKLEKENLSDNTKKQYYNTIKNIQKMYDNTDIITILKNDDILINKINSLDLSNESKKYRYTAIISIIKKCKLNINLEKYEKEFNIYADKTKAEFTDRRDNTTAIEWNKILDIYDKIPKNYDIKHLLTSLYVLQPPIRDDYANVLIVNKKSNITDELDEEKQNYYILSTGTFYLNKYKTYKTFGQTKLEAPTELKKIIKKSLEKKPRDYLIIKDDGTPYIRLSKVVKRFFGYSINDLRHSYITEFCYNKQIKSKDKEALARNMMHSLILQNGYQREG